MKKALITLILLVGFLNLTAQNASVAWYNWSNPETFLLSPPPLITGWGVHSDSLSHTFNGKMFYEFNGEYYPISNWAEYYLWFVNKYWYNFTDPQLYEYYYLQNDDYEMARYIAGDNYQGYYYPSRINITFVGKDVDVNRLNANSKYIASNDKKVKKLEKQVTFSEEQYKKEHDIKKNEQIGNKNQAKLHKIETKNELNNKEYKHKTNNNSSTNGNSSGNTMKSEGIPSSNTQKKSSGSKTIK
ncbi:MAG: hypothetical protein DRJ10_07195 [Bacteroidetes bacterium]|nr:MAG: hypothetical protein DRJ10_07195 [Bacteroidota bacterium]